MSDPRAFVALLNENNHLLVIARSRSSKNGGLLGLPGGHMDNQTVTTAVARELREEVGIDITLFPREKIGELLTERNGDPVHIVLWKILYKPQIPWVNHIEPDPKEVSMATFLPLRQVRNVALVDRHYSLDLFLNDELLNRAEELK